MKYALVVIGVTLMLIAAPLGIWTCVSGIIDVINGIKANWNAAPIAWGVIKFMAAAPIGWLCFVLGAFLVKES